MSVPPSTVVILYLPPPALMPSSDVLGADSAGDYVVGEDLGEGGLILGLHQGVDGAGGEFSKGSRRLVRRQ
jgi:hypothetical protein